MYRIAALCAVIGLFYIMPWDPLVRFQRDVTLWLLRVEGFPAAAGDYLGTPAIVVHAQIYYFTARCAYIDLAMIVSVLTWNPGKGTRRNLLVTGVGSAGIVAIAFVRTWVAMSLRQRGCLKLWAHDIPNGLLYLTILVAAVAAAVRRESLGWRSDARRRASRTTDVPE